MVHHYPLLVSDESDLYVHRLQVASPFHAINVMKIIDSLEGEEGQCDE